MGLDSDWSVSLMARQDQWHFVGWLDIASVYDRALHKMVLRARLHDGPGAPTVFSQIYHTA